MSKQNQTIKIAVVGDRNVGKTQLQNRFHKSTYYESYSENYTQKSYREITDVNSTTQYCFISDDVFLNTHRVDYLDHSLQRKDLYLICYDTTDKRSLEVIPAFLAAIQRYSKTDKPLIALVGTKNDLIKKKEVTTEEAQQIADRHGLAFFETSAKHDTNIENVFFHSIAEKKRQLADDNEAQCPNFIDKKNAIINKLDAYIKRIEGYSDFKHGFIFFRQSRAWNREANYQLAKELKNKLLEMDSYNEIRTLFKDSTIKNERNTIAANIFGKSNSGNHGLNSKELNAILADAKTAFPAPQTTEHVRPYQSQYKA